MQISKKTFVILFFLQLAAFWPVMRWYVIRTMDTSDAPWGLISLGTAFLLLLVNRPPRSTANVRLVVPAILVMIYAATFPFLPPLLRASIAFGAIGCYLSSYRFGTMFHPGVVGLLLLSLPVVPTMQFYLGYPFRMIAGVIAVSLIKVAGFSIRLEGAVLNWGGQLICIDAPCSGIKMLWVGLYLALTLALHSRLSARKTLLVTVLSIVVIVAANSLRAAALFFVEAELFLFPPWFHEGVGIAVFLLAASAIVWEVRTFRGNLLFDPIYKREELK